MVEKSQTGLWPSLYDPFRSFGQRADDYLAPLSDAKLADGAYRITMELPGVSEDEIDVTVADGVVTVKGEKASEHEEQGDTWYFAERQYGQFSRSFRLPGDADETEVSADLKDGVLTVSVPKTAPEMVTTKKVEIRKS